MKKAIYFGNVAAHIAVQPAHADRPLSSVTSSTLTFTGFDLSAIATVENKLDLLFYNRVNEIGEILSSLVYISNILEPNDVTEKVYDVKKLYVNTEVERLLGITDSMTDFTYLNCKWGSSSFFTTSISPLSGTSHEELATNGIPSIKLEQNGIAFDGWYTQLSVGVRTLNVGNPPSTWAKNLIGYHEYADLGTELSILLSNTASYDDTNWSPYFIMLTDGTVNPNGTILSPGTSLANILVTLSLDNPYIKQDLFILPTYLDLYDEAVVQYAEYPTYGNMFPVLRDKHRVIHNFAENNEFLDAQYILQTTEYARMTL
jgi:hypothetical protein